MNKNIIRIALTGGPSAGKTTALAKIIERFSDLGYLVYALPETPTLFSNASINFATSDKQYFYNIEKAVLKYQIQMEDIFLELARSSKQPVLIIADRGTMDISAYMEPTIWQAMLDELGLSEVKLRDTRYDAVIHMVTAALGAEEFYTTENNSARHESVEQARAVDQRILKAWTGHPYLRIVENNVDFDAKIDHTLRLIQAMVGDDTGNYIKEKKYKFKVRIIGEIPYGVEAEIYQAYVMGEDGLSIRLRKRGLKGNYVYFMSEKHLTPEVGKSIITDRQISPDEYLTRMNQINLDNANVVHKQRKSFIWADQYFELDQFYEPECDFYLLEAKVEEHTELRLPPFVEVIEEVSSNPMYDKL